MNNILKLLIENILILILIFLLVISSLLIILRKQASKMRVVKNTYFSFGNLIPFVHISDLHFPLLQISYRRIINTIKGCSPHFIVITGDLAQRGRQKGVEDFFYLLTKETSCPIYLTLGNHDNEMFKDKMINKEAYINRFEELFPSVKILENDWTLYESDEKSILIGGFADFYDDETYGKRDLSLSKGDYINKLLDKWGKLAKEKGASFLVASHNPDIMTFIEEKKADLFIFGHTHGGQVYLPFRLEFWILRRDILPRKGYIYGRYVYKGNEIYITSGLGTSFLPIRFRSLAEICLNYL